MRAAIVNHRTGEAHIYRFVAELLATTRRLQGQFPKRP
jgi:hypothetical protein